MLAMLRFASVSSPPWHEKQCSSSSGATSAANETSPGAERHRPRGDRRSRRGAAAPPRATTSMPSGGSEPSNAAPALIQRERGDVGGRHRAAAAGHVARQDHVDEPAGVAAPRCTMPDRIRPGVRRHPEAALAAHHVAATARCHQDRRHVARKGDGADRLADVGLRRRGRSGGRRPGNGQRGDVRAGAFQFPADDFRPVGERLECGGGTRHSRQAREARRCPRRAMQPRPPSYHRRTAWRRRRCAPDLLR